MAGGRPVAMPDEFFVLSRHGITFTATSACGRRAHRRHGPGFPARAARDVGVITRGPTPGRAGTSFTRPVSSSSLRLESSST